MLDPARATTWNILLVDDERDIHAVTGLVLRNKRWRNRGFHLTSAFSRREAMELLASGRDFHVAIVDVVMETSDAGLVLCEHIRRTLPGSTRIILRTGQPGGAPEEAVLSAYDIDYYLAKADATPNKLFAVIRACIRSSQDISTLLAYGRQLQSFTRALQTVTSVEDLLVFMLEALRFLELKHACRAALVYDTSDAQAVLLPATDHVEPSWDGRELVAAVMEAHAAQATLLRAHPVERRSSRWVIPFAAADDRSGHGARRLEPALGGLIFDLTPDQASEKARADILTDAVLFLENWCIAFSTLRLRARLAEEQLLRDRMYFERLESIATMVTGVAHELNTPLGVARTASSVLVELVKGSLAGASEADAAQVADVEDACHLLNKNLDRANRLIQSFKQLSASQLSDERAVTDLRALAEDCVETMLPELRRRSITASVRVSADLDARWEGFPGHLSQVLINLIQNTLRYAYDEGAPGTIEISIELSPVRRPGFRIEFADQGRGVPAEIQSRLFEPFVTTGRDRGGTGLGLAIVRNIVANLLGGSVTCTSSPGHGARFTIDIPEPARPA